MKCNEKENTENERKIRQKCHGKRLSGELSSLKNEFNNSMYWKDYKMERVRKRRNTTCTEKHVIQNGRTDIKKEIIIQGPNYLIIYNTGKVPEGKFRAEKFM